MTDRPIPTGKAPSVPLHRQLEHCKGIHMNVPLNPNGRNVTCPVCGITQKTEEFPAAGIGVVPPHWSTKARTEYPERRARIHIMADYLFRIECFVCTQLERRHPVWRLPIWLVYTLLQTSYVALLVCYAGISHLPAVLSGRLDDLGNFTTDDSTDS